MTECFLSDIKNKAKMPGLTISFLNTLLDVLDRVIKQEKEKRNPPDWEGSSKAVAVCR